MTVIKNRSEILFLYDVKNCNPNGDPMDANRPRINEDTGKCLVTDVRLKRTIRDHLFDSGYNGTEKNKDIFIRDEDGKVVTGNQRSLSYENKDDFLKKFIDVRLFGAVSAPKKENDKTFHFTGPVQFGMGVSLNRVKENLIKGTGAFATKEGSKQRTFREEYNITYGFIAFHGVINENAAKHTYTTEKDIDALMKGIWSGTKNLLTRSKKGHMPRLLIKIDYQDGFFIGDLVERVSLILSEGQHEESIEDISDFTVDTSSLNKVLQKYQDKILKVTIEQDDRITLSEPIFTKQ
ncbi:MAG: type I-B CRISPR-associated protein Cas7/Csh2 [Bacteroidota bacterium]